uniref:Nucleolar and coiled-body phosphoprotein 1 n=1 Tax=Macrostomum lignano TaxID=282301 RepID=A0A1I8FP94_9PLAT
SDITFKKVKRSIRVKQPAVVLPKPSSLADGSDSDNDSEKDPPATAAPSNSKSNSSKHQQAKSSKSADVPTLTASASALSFQDDLIADGRRRVSRRLRYDKEAAAAASAAYPGNSGARWPGSSAADEIQEVEMEDDYPVSVQQLRSQRPIGCSGPTRNNQAGASDDTTAQAGRQTMTHSGFGGGDDSDVADVSRRDDNRRRQPAAEFGDRQTTTTTMNYDDDDGFPGAAAAQRAYERQQLRTGHRWGSRRRCSGIGSSGSAGAGGGEGGGIFTRCHRACVAYARSAPKRITTPIKLVKLNCWNERLFSGTLAERSQRQISTTRQDVRDESKRGERRHVAAKTKRENLTAPDDRRHDSGERHRRMRRRRRSEWVGKFRY